MAIFQVPDLDSARRRIADLAVRVVWKIDLPDMAGTRSAIRSPRHDARPQSSACPPPTAMTPRSSNWPKRDSG